MGVVDTIILLFEVAAALVGLGILFVIGTVLWNLPRNRRLAAERDRQKVEQAASDAEYNDACDALLSTSFAGWQYVERASVNRRTGLIGLSNDGSTLRFLTWGREGSAPSDIIDRNYAARQITGLSIDQPQTSRVVTHKEKTPVAVNVRRSAGGRALVGGIVAGPAGAIIGGASGLNSKSKIRMVETERHETVYSKGRATLIVQLDDLTTPRRSLFFADATTTNEWSARLHAAMQRARS